MLNGIISLCGSNDFLINMFVICFKDLKLFLIFKYSSKNWIVIYLFLHWFENFLGDPCIILFHTLPTAHLEGPSFVEVEDKTIIGLFKRNFSWYVASKKWPRFISQTSIWIFKVSWTSCPFLNLNVWALFRRVSHNYIHLCKVIRDTSVKLWNFCSVYVCDYVVDRGAQRSSYPDWRVYRPH